MGADGWQGTESRRLPDQQHGLARIQHDRQGLLASQENDRSPTLHVDRQAALLAHLTDKNLAALKQTLLGNRLLRNEDGL